jgi:integrase
MKTKKEHVVPLSRRALEILQWMADRRHNDRVFPGRNFGGTMDSDALRNLLPKGTALLPPGSALWGRRKGPSLHGMRSAFMDWCGDNETIEVPMEVAERALSHAIGGQNFRSYRRGTALEKRRILMQQWADFLGGVPA